MVPWDFTYDQSPGSMESVYMVYTRAGAGGRSSLSRSVTVWTQDGEDILLSDLSGRIVQRFESVAF